MCSPREFRGLCPHRLRPVPPHSALARGAGFPAPLKLVLSVSLRQGYGVVFCFRKISTPGSASLDFVPAPSANQKIAPCKNAMQSAIFYSTISKTFSYLITDISFNTFRKIKLYGLSIPLNPTPLSFSKNPPTLFTTVSD